MQERVSNYDRQPSYRSMINDSQTKYEQGEEDNKFTSLTKIYEEQEKRKFAQLENSNMLTNYKLKNQKEKQQKIDEKERSRRSRKDKEGRDYKCGCGKTYLSYPALYTHIKQKHEGKQPEGTTRLNSNGPNRRGRPRRHRVQQSLNSLEDNPAKAELPRVLTIGVNKQPMMVFEQYEDIVQGNIFAEDNITFDKFVDQIQKIKREQTKEISVKMCVDEVLAIYLYNMAEICNSRFFKLLQETLISFRGCMNVCYKSILQEYQQKSKIYTQQLINENLNQRSYCQVYSAQYLPLAAQYFILQYAPKEMQKLDQKLLICIIQDLCYWLDQKKLTHIKLSRYSIQIIPNLSLEKMLNY